VVRININYIHTMVNAIKIQCNLKGNYTRKIKSYTKLHYTLDTHTSGYYINISALNFSKYATALTELVNNFSSSAVGIPPYQFSECNVRLQIKYK